MEASPPGTRANSFCRADFIPSLHEIFSRAGSLKQTVGLTDIFRVSPKKLPLSYFCGITSLYLIKGSNFLQWIEKQSYYINRSIYLTQILNRSASRDT